MNKVVQVVDITIEKEQDTATKSNSYQQQIVIFEQKAKKDEEEWDSDNRDIERHKDESLVESIQQTAREGDISLRQKDKLLDNLKKNKAGNQMPLQVTPRSSKSKSNIHSQ